LTRCPAAAYNFAAVVILQYAIVSQASTELPSAASVAALTNQALKELDAVSDADGAEQWRVSYPARRGRITGVLRSIPQLEPDERREVGTQANQAKNALEEALARLNESAGPIASRLFVLDRSQRLVGAVTLGQLLGSRLDTHVESLELDTAPGMPSHASAQALGARQASSGPIAVVDPQGLFLGIIGADTLTRLGGHKVRPPALHLLASLGEFYSLGFSALFGGPRSGPHATNQPGEVDRANS